MKEVTLDMQNLYRELLVSFGKTCKHHIIYTVGELTHKSTSLRSASASTISWLKVLHVIILKKYITENCRRTFLI